MFRQALTVRYRAAVALLAALLSVAVAHAAAVGYVRIRSGDVYLRDDVWYLDVSVNYRLSRAAREALESGVTLQLQMDIQVQRPGWFWWEDTVARLAQRYRVRYHALSERYVLVRLNSGESRSFRSLGVLMSELGEVRALPVIDANLLDAGVTYEVAVRAGLDIDALPRPLRAMAYILPQWQLESEWRRWPLRDS